MLEAYGVKVQIVILTNAAPALCGFVAAGLGVSLIHPLMLSGMEHRLAVRRFAPEILFSFFQLCRSADTRNAELIEAFAQEVRATAAQISRTMLSGS